MTGIHRPFQANCLNLSELQDYRDTSLLKAQDMDTTILNCSVCFSWTLSTSLQKKVIESDIIFTDNQQ